MKFLLPLGLFYICIGIYTALTEITNQQTDPTDPVSYSTNQQDTISDGIHHTEETSPTNGENKETSPTNGKNRETSPTNSEKSEITESRASPTTEFLTTKSSLTSSPFLEFWFKNEPEDTKGTDGSNAYFKCKVDSKISVKECIWIKNGRKVDLSLPNYKPAGDKNQGDCSIYYNITADFSVEDNSKWICGVQTDQGTILSRTATLTVYGELNGPFYNVNGYSDIKNNLDFIIKGNQHVALRMYEYNAYPHFTNESMSVEIDGKLQENLPVLVQNSTNKPGTNNIESMLSIPLTDKSVNVTMTFFHPVWYGGKATRTLIFRLSEKPLPVKPVSIAVLKEGKVSFSMKNANFGTKCDWFQKNLTTNKWFSVKEGGSSTYPLSSSVIQETGLKVFQMRVKQPMYYNIEARSEELSILTYELMTKIEITTPLLVNITVPEPVTLQCKGDGYPEPNIQWVKVTENGLKVVGKSGNLTVGRYSDDVGKYKCEALQSLFSQTIVKVAPAVVTVRLQQ